MSRLPQSHFTPSTPAPRPRSNGLGVAGFVLSIVGLVGCCIPPVLFIGALGCLLSFVAMFRSPRSLAIVGFILGLLQSVVLAVLLLLMGGLIFAVTALPSYFKSVQSMVEIGRQIEQYRATNGTLPTALNQLSGVTLTDAWGNPFIYKLDPAAGTYEIITNGMDGQPNTDDDLSLPGDIFRGAAGRPSTTSTPRGGAGGGSGTSNGGSDSDDANGGS